jgi:hypothetical protein
MAEYIKSKTNTKILRSSVYDLYSQDKTQKNIFCSYSLISL